MELEVETVDEEVQVLGCDAALLDADGTLYKGYENGPVEEARRVALTALGFVVPPFERLRGLTGAYAYLVIEKFQAPEERARLAVEWEDILGLFQSKLRMPEALTPLPDALDFLREAKGRGLPTGITTNSSFDSWVAKAGKLPDGALGNLSTVVTMSCVGGKPKPHPDMLIEGARRLGASAPILFGDSKVDARAALNAQMPSIIRRDGRSEQELRWIRAHGARIVEDFSKVQIRV